MLYKNCRELLQHNFNEIQLTGDLKYLIKDNQKHKKKELKRHWVKIIDEWIILSDSQSSKKFLRDSSKLKTLEAKRIVLLNIKQAVLDEHFEESEEFIQEMVKKFRANSLENAILSINDEINLLISRLSKERIEKKSSNFDKDLAAMRRSGCHVDRFGITVSEWIELIKPPVKKSAK